SLSHLFCVVVRISPFIRWPNLVCHYKSLVAGKTVTVTYFQRDHYGRILGQVYAPDGMNVNQFMVRAGDAWVYEQYNTDPVLPVLQGEVRQQKRGLWADSAPVPPWV
ncbi:thermonuclease family protein, partial [Escherichia coli]